ncbi:hypothetical protein THIOM_003042 [Candidatus Thiomargarita nelsonii]|uniref:Uncharacterized protein n=1 Tax=Candidatus Thiomargarita nelsonii TaxID=1003181 RepID=A0A176RZT3_9GAMM|nr:hypothetical protein THIOM_003042 [Candidatus Thiomargarita nelsonii]
MGTRKNLNNNDKNIKYRGIRTQKNRKPENASVLNVLGFLRLASIRCTHHRERQKREKLELLVGQIYLGRLVACRTRSVRAGIPTLRVGMPASTLRVEYYFNAGNGPI